MMIIEGRRGFHMGAQAAIVEDGRELAWAEKHVTKQDDIKWILGNFVAADEHNSNGHWFPLNDLQQTHTSVVHKPLNMLHREHQIVGVFAADELLGVTAEHADYGGPHMEALSAFYRYYFSQLYDQVVLPAHREGTLFYSMEAVPKTVTCEGVGEDPGCGQEFDYKGRVDASYCAHLNTAGVRKRLNMPHFTGGALIVPPVRPGWRRADAGEFAKLDELVKRNVDEVDRLYEQTAAEFPHLDPKEWERMMADLLNSYDGGGISRATMLDGTGFQTFGQVPVRADDDGGDGYDKGTGPSVGTGHSLPDGSWTIFTVDDVAEAVQRATSGGLLGPDEEVREHIMRWAEALGRFDLIPDDWKAAYPDYKRETAMMLGRLGFGLHDDYTLEYEIARDFSTARRADLAKKGLAMEGGRYPIVTVGDLRNAIKAIGRAKGDVGKVKAHIKKRAAALGATKLIPEGW